VLFAVIDRLHTVNRV